MTYIIFLGLQLIPSIAVEKNGMGISLLEEFLPSENE